MPTPKHSKRDLLSGWPDWREVLRGSGAAAESLRDLATVLGVPNRYFGRLEESLRNPSVATLKALATVISFSGRSLALMADLLERDDGVRPVPESISRDPELTPRQREVLLELYESFVRSRR